MGNYYGPYSMEIYGLGFVGFVSGSDRGQECFPMEDHNVA